MLFFVAGVAALTVRFFEAASVFFATVFLVGAFFSAAAFFVDAFFVAVDLVEAFVFLGAASF